MRTELQDLQQDLGVTTIYVTHDQTEAMTMGDRIAILDGGELQQIGTPAECYQEPTNQFVAGFIGSPSMNFFDVTLSSGRLRNDDFAVTLSDAAESAASGRGPEFVMGIRPEEILSGEEAANHPDSFDIDVNVVEPLGDVTYLYTEFGGTEATVSVDRNTEIEPGDTVTIAFPTDEVHLFDTDTGEALVNRGTPVSERHRMEETVTSDGSEA
jgi:multiple sugar transport system ATP-binding protein